MPLRLGIVLSHPTQYYSPWFRWVRQHSEIEFRVFYLWQFGVTAQRDPQFQTTFQWNVDLLSGYESEFVPNVASDPGTHHFWGLRNPHLTSRLNAWRPDLLLLFGYKWASHLRAIAWARRHRVPLLFRGDSHFLGRADLPRWKQAPLRAIYSQFAAFLGVGKANRDYFLRLGVPPQDIFFAPHSVDASLYNPARPEYSAAAAALRADLGVAANTTVVLYAGKLVAAKQPRMLLEAFLSCHDPTAALVFVGEGPEKTALIDRARAAGSAGVHFLPFANQAEMPVRYLLGDVFVLPSRGGFETWGLAVNESMHMGVPAIVSDVVGCQRDLVTEGETGWVFRTENAGELADALRRAIDTVRAPVRRAALRENVLQRISGYTYAQTTAGLERALAEVGRHSAS